VAEFGLSPLAAVLLSVLVGAGGVAALRHWAEVLPEARPTSRSLHERPVLRVGGLAVWAGFTPVALLSPPVPGIPTLAWAPAWLAVATVSLIDDWRGVHPIPRLTVHGVAAVTAAVGLFGTLPTASSVPSWLIAVALLSLLIAWSANLFNFMDGNDGLAAMMSACGFAAYAIAAAIAGAPMQSYAALAAATIPFLAVNLPPARAFMGDVGAVPLGFLAAAFGIGGWRQGIWPAWLPLLVFLPFVIDATTTLLRRLLRGERVWEAHRTHYYQRLHQLGARHGGTLAAYCGLMVGTAATALVVLVQRPDAGWWALAAWTAIIGALFARIDYHWSQKKTNSP
jgi:UDP-N-acetylmuramyl pentapeptide phosphotransferase/UDP-N-acetylglucosamine-1-phosphate transferase